MKMMLQKKRAFETFAFKNIGLVSFFICCTMLGYAQNSPTQKKDFIVVRAVVEDGDTMPYITLKTVNVIDFRGKMSAKEKRRRTKLTNNIIKVYPYARMAAERLEEYDKMLASIPSQEGRSKAMKKVEKSIVKEFTPTIEELTFSQGLILLKLVDRETGKTTYKIVDELRGKMRAFFYQSIARLWHYNLKERYDPTGKDKEIEVIVQKIERGEIVI